VNREECQVNLKGLTQTQAETDSNMTEQQLLSKKTKMTQTDRQKQHSTNMHVTISAAPVCRTVGQCTFYSTMYTKLQYFIYCYIDFVKYDWRTKLRRTHVISNDKKTKFKLPGLKDFCYP